MSFQFSQLFTKHCAGVLAAAALAGCATFVTTPEEAVRQRAARQWTARLSNDLDTSYSLTPPSYRAITTLEAYKKGFGNAVVIKSADVVDVKCETADKCVAQVKIEAAPMLTMGRRALPPLVTYADETWIREDRQWWLFPTR